MRHRIVTYRGGRDADIVSLILGIQRDEVRLHVPVEEQQELLGICQAYHEDNFWLAIADDDIVGTIGVLRYGSCGILRKLFVRADHRGPGGVAHALFDRAMGWAAERGLDAVLLDTPAIAARSHAFYRRKGFQVVDRSELPDGYFFPDRDSLIFKKAVS